MKLTPPVRYFHARVSGFVWAIDAEGRAVWYDPDGYFDSTSNFTLGRMLGRGYVEIFPKWGWAVPAELLMPEGL